MTSITTFTSDKRHLFTLLGRIRDLKIQLPDFQRGWIWDDEHVRSLVASISLSYPVGAVMMLEAKSTTVNFKVRPVPTLDRQAMGDTAVRSVPQAPSLPDLLDQGEEDDEAA